MAEYGKDENGKLLKGFIYAKGGKVVPAPQQKAQTTRIKVERIVYSQENRAKPLYEHLVLSGIPTDAQKRRLEKKYNASYLENNGIPQLVRLK